MTKRAAPPWTPMFSEVEGAAVNLCRRNLWRVSPLYDFEDLMQEARLKFLQLQIKYPRVVEAPHFMSLFYISFVNHLHRLASQRHRDAMGHTAGVWNQGRAMEHFDDGDEDTLASLADPRPYAVAEECFDARVMQASAMIRALVERVNASVRKITRRRRATGARESTNTFLCRLVGLDPDHVDMRRELDLFVGNAIQ